MFSKAARVLGGDVAVAERLGRGWALFDLARHQSDAAIAVRADALAGKALAGSLGGVARPLGMLALSARLELAGIRQGGPKRAARLMWFGLAGR